MAIQSLDQALDQTLRSIMQQGMRADQAVGLALREGKKWLPKEKNEFVSTVYGIVANWRRLWFLLDEEPNNKWHPDTSKRLRLCLEYLKTGQHPDQTKTEEGRRFAKRLLNSGKTIDLRDSWPDWLADEGSRAWGTDWPAISASLHEAAPVFIRVNTLKTTIQDLRHDLNHIHIETELIESFPLSLLARGTTRQLLKSPQYAAGLFEVQDLHSQAVAQFADPKPGQLIADFCAGEGGKSLHLACLMHNKGRLLVGDIAQWKLDKLKLRARKAGVSNIDIIAVAESKRWKRMHGKMDTVLIDAPCSGLGSLRRHPDIKWRLNPESIENLNTTQDQLLQACAALPKSGGAIVYATCSILPVEGEKRVQAFLQAVGPAFKLEKELRRFPRDGDGDGFYMAKLTRLA